MILLFLILFAIQGIIFGVACNLVLRNRGYDDNWFIWGFFFSWVAIIVALSKPQNDLDYYGDTHLSGYGRDSKEAALSEWRCYNCMTLNPGYVGTCKCGVTKDDNNASKA